jgi:hypothetical protein
LTLRAGDYSPAFLEKHFFGSSTGARSLTTNPRVEKMKRTKKETHETEK